MVSLALRRAEAAALLVDTQCPKLSWTLSVQNSHARRRPAAAEEKGGEEGCVVCRGASAAPASMTGAPIASSTPSVPRAPNAPCRARRARRGAERRARRARPRAAAQREPPRAGAGGVARTRAARGESSTRPSPTQSSSGAATGATRRDSLEGERRTVTLASFGFVQARPSDAYSRMRGALNNRESTTNCVSPLRKFSRCTAPPSRLARR